MDIAYVLLYDVGDGGMEISGVYSNLQIAKDMVPVKEWKEHEGIKGFWEGFDPDNRLWYIEAHAVQG